MSRLFEDGPELGSGALGGAVGEVEDYEVKVLALVRNRACRRHEITLDQLHGSRSMARDGYTYTPQRNPP
jgi:hypothetical protein